MTQASNISIPARFVFRPYRVQWVRTWALIEDWAVSREKVSQLGVFAELLGKPQTPKRDDVLVRIGIPRMEYSSGWPRSDFFECELKRCDLPPDCLQPHETPETTPDIECRVIELLACRLDVVNGIEATQQPNENAEDAWTMREQFFNLEKDTLALCQFLTRWGHWNYQRQFEPGTLRVHPFTIVFPHRLWSLRDSYIKAVAGSPRSWLTTAAPLSLKETDKPPYLIVQRSRCEDAIQATITIDLLAKVKFGICKRHDCRRLFKRVTAQKRLYCTPKCAHLANVRKLRAKKKKTESTGRKHGKGKS
jgi:hypothetical protein